MTPEQLEEIPEVGADAVEQIQVGVNAYYSQFEEPAAPTAEPAAEGVVEEAAAVSDALETQAGGEQFGRIEDAGSTTQNSEAEAGCRNVCAIPGAIRRLPWPALKGER
jgi:hypothetical protein